MPADVQRLVDLVERLRAPDGCPWDREQTVPDLRPFVLEEAHEVAAAIDSGDWEELRGELGDLLFQVVFLSSLAHQAGAFDLSQVIDAIHDKMVARHPHVFGDAVAHTAGDVRRQWERRKAADPNRQGSILAGVPTSLPALVASYRLTQKAAAVGFDWPDRDGVTAKVSEELAEVEATTPGDKDALKEELGDLLFAVANLARHHGLDPETALAAANAKFRRRFAAIEDELARRGRPLAEATLDEMDAIWNEVKKTEKQPQTAAR